MIKTFKDITQKFVDPHVHQELLKKKKAQIKSFKVQMERNRGFKDRLAEISTRIFGSNWFLVINLMWFTIWMVLNTGFFSAIVPFDPYPFSLLTMMVSLEAILLSIFVLISQNRASRIGELREEIDLQINVQAEQEITRILCMVDEIHDHLGLEAKDDAELKKMKEKTDIFAIEEAISKEIEESN